MDCHRILLVVFVIPYATSYEVNILNTAIATSNLEGWMVKTYINEAETNSSVAGWEELSFTHQNATLRGYQICPKENNVLQLKVQSWLRSPLVEVEDVSRVYVELKFWMRECSDLKDTRCRETFKVYCRFLNEAFNEDDHLNEQYYQSIDTVAAESKFNPQWDPEPINTETVSISLVKQNGNFVAKKSNLYPKFYIAFVDEGACIALASVRIFYKVCNEVVNHLAYFERTIAGPYDTSLIPVDGKCVTNSRFSLSHLTANQTSPLYHCTSSGDWNIRTGTCLCDAGFEPDQFHSACVKCPLNYFKSSAGNEKCTPCPLNSYTIKNGSTQCQCAFQNQTYLPMSSTVDCELCAKLPSPPMNLNITVEQHSSSTLELSWSSPVDNGQCKQVKYCILCQSCSPNNNHFDVLSSIDQSCMFGNLSLLTVDELSCNGLSYLPQQCENLYPFVAIRNLEAQTSYRFIVLALNAVSMEYQTEFYSFMGNIGSNSRNNSTSLNIDLLNEQMRTLISTSAAVVNHDVRNFLPSEVINVHVMRKNRTSATIAWSMPYSINDRIDHSVTYELQWYPVSMGKNVSAASPRLLADTFPYSKTVADTSTVLDGLRSGISYEVVVRAKNTAGYGNFSKPMYFRLTSGNLGSSTEPAHFKDSMRNYVTLSVVLVVIVVILIAIVLLWNKNKIKTNAPVQVEQRDSDTDSSDNEIPVEQRTYVDPFFLRTSQSNFECETRPELVTTSCVIGCGEFGEVYQGVLVKKDANGCGIDQRIDVAVKQLRAQCQPHEQFDFLREANALATFQHPNIVKLEAVVTGSRPFMIVTELMKNGCLAAFLQRHREAGRAFPPLVLVRMMEGVAKGMEYLNGLNFIHRDLAARNVLINEELECKVADFGLTRRIEGEGFADESSPTYQGGKIAIRWTAPEAVAYNRYSQASDVWSFGVFAWEVMTYAEKPYWNLTNQQILLAVNEGFRLPAPEDCPAVLHQLMLDCWHGERNTRPTFTQVLSKLEEMERNPEILSTLASAASTGVEEKLLADSTDFPTAGIPNSDGHHEYTICQAERQSLTSSKSAASCFGGPKKSEIHGVLEKPHLNKNSDCESLVISENPIENCDEVTAMLEIENTPAVMLVIDEKADKLAKYTTAHS